MESIASGLQLIICSGVYRQIVTVLTRRAEDCAELPNPCDVHLKLIGY